MALSTTEVEYITAGACCTQILYMKQTLLDYGVVLEKVPLLCDNESCNTSGVLNTKTCHVVICIAHHSCVSENFDMYTLKQVYLYVVCVELYCLNQVQKFVWIRIFKKTLIYSI